MRLRMADCGLRIASTSLEPRCERRGKPVESAIGNPQSAMVFLVASLLAPAAVAAQGVQSATLRRAIQAYEAVDFRQTIALGRQALRERLTSPERARAYELLGFAFGATNQPDSSIRAFQEMIQLDPDRELGRVSPRLNGYFQAALGQVLVVRQMRVDSTRFVAGQGFLPIRYTVTSPARVTARAVSGRTSALIDSSVTSGQVNLRWPAQLPDGQPLPPGEYTIVVEARGAGQSSFSVSRRLRIEHGAVDTVAHLTALPGYEYLPETEVPAKSWRPLGLAFLYTGAAASGVLLLQGDLHPEAGAIAAVGVGTVLTGFIASLRTPAPQPARANILYNRLLREQLARRNADIARENQARRQAVEIRAIPLPGGAR